VRRLIALQSLVDSRVRLERCADELLTKLDEADALAEQLTRTETGQGALVLARLRPRLTLLRASVLTGLGRTNDALERARTLAAEAHPLALLQAATIWATCAAATNDEEERAERKRQAIDCVARALEAEPGDELIASWLGSTVLAPLRGEAEFASVLEFWGLEQWLER